MTKRAKGTAAPAPPPSGVIKKTTNPTKFQYMVYEVCKLIPVGRVSTYGAIAAVLHSAPRAVGQALRCNPYAPVVPCHRVIAATLDIGGFTGSWGLGCASVQKKIKILAGEGVAFDASGKLKEPNKSLLSVSELQTLVDLSKRPTIKS